MTAAVSTVLASVASTLINLPIVYRETKDRAAIRGLLLISLLITIFGVASFGLLDMFHPGPGFTVGLALGRDIQSCCGQTWRYFSYLRNDGRNRFAIRTDN
jgi:hypothetical protein